MLQFFSVLVTEFFENLKFNIAVTDKKTWAF